MKCCPDALKLLKKKVLLCKDCPLLGNCPRCILEDELDKGVRKGVTKAMKALLKLKGGK